MRGDEEEAEDLTVCSLHNKWRQNIKKANCLYLLTMSIYQNR